jgi:hypothetical protein
MFFILNKYFRMIFKVKYMQSLKNKYLNIGIQFLSYQYVDLILFFMICKEFVE